MGLWSRLRNATSRRGEQMDGIDDEMEFHLQSRTQELVAEGIQEPEARRIAALTFGNRGKLRDEVRAVETMQWLVECGRDFHLAIRNLRKRPVLVGSAVSSIALSLAAVTALFSYVDALFLRPLPLREPGEIVALTESVQGKDTSSNPARLEDYAQQLPQFSSVAGFYSDGAVLREDGEPARIHILRSYGALMETLGQQPLIGRAFTTDEEAGQGTPAAVISYGLWQRKFGGDRSVLNRALHIDDGVVILVGVLPQGQMFPEGVDVMAPAPPALRMTSRSPGFLQIVARRNPTIPLTEVESALKLLGGRLARQYPATDAGRSVHAVGLQEKINEQYRQPVFLLFSASALTLLMACLNVGNLLLARGAERAREAAIRISLGAGRISVMRLYLTESFLLAGAGGILGVAGGAAAFAELQRLLPPSLELPVAPHFDWRVIAVGAVLSVFSGMLFGLGPAWMAYSTQPMRSLSGTQTTAGRGNLRWRKGLVVVQVAMGTILLTGVGLAGRSLYFTRIAPLGFDPAQAYTVAVKYSWDTPQAKLNSVVQRTLENLSGTRGVVAAGMIDRLPLEGNSQSQPMRVEGSEKDASLLGQPVNKRAYAGDYFEALSVPILQGRLPRAHAAGDSPETVVNSAFVRKYFPGGDAVGHRITQEKTAAVQTNENFLRVVGVVGNTRVEATQTEEPAEFFVRAEDTFWPYLNYVVKVRMSGKGRLNSVRDAIRVVDPTQVVGAVTPVGEAISDAWIDQKVRLALLGGFACVALLLACVGVYGVLTGDVVQRKQELGLRLALGADRAHVVRMILKHGLWLSSIGFVIGAVVAFFLGKIVESTLYDVRVTDPATWLGAMGLMLLLTLTCSLLPASLASRIDPARTLYSE